jgi:hypothetical protein
VIPFFFTTEITENTERKERRLFFTAEIAEFAERKRLNRFGNEPTSFSFNYLSVLGNLSGKKRSSSLSYLLFSPCSL